MKKVLILLLVLTLAVGCGGCFCGHSWVEADCLNAKTCPLCGKVEGEPLGHRWQEATCLAPQTCGACGETQGETVDHRWVEASCAAPRNCQWCGLTEGEALDHTWQNATTEAPKTCAACGATEGERIITDQRFTTAANQALFGSWKTELVLTGEELKLGGYMDEVTVNLVTTFGEDGTVEIRAAFEDEAAFVADLTRITAELLYQQFEAMDIGREDADVMFEDAYSMDIQTYAESIWSGTDWNAMLDMHSSTGVYYAEEGKVNMAASWEGEFKASAYTLAGDKLSLTNPEGKTTELTRVK